MLIPLGLTTATSAAADEGIHKKISGSETYGSGRTTLIISNKETEDIMKIVTGVLWSIFRIDIKTHSEQLCKIYSKKKTIFSNCFSF